MLYVEPTQTDLTEAVKIAIPDERALLVRSLLNYDAPHYFVRFHIAGCTPGLEILEKYEHLLISRRLLNFIHMEPKSRLAAYVQFDVKNSRGMQLYLALEGIKSYSKLKWTRDARRFEVSFYDFHCREVFTVKRTLSLRYLFAQYLCLYCTYGFQGCGNSADIFAADGKKLGSIQQKLSFYSTTFHIYNGEGQHVMTVDGIVTDGILDVQYPDEDDPIAMIETLMDDTEVLDYYKVSVPRLTLSSGITFFKNYVKPEQKALLLSTVILLDYMMLQPTGDYPHLAQQIPNDFHSSTLPKSSLHRHESTELLILTERPKRSSQSHHERRKLRGTWGCCIWCGRLLCLCCFLGMRRNGIRCVCLGFGIISAPIILYFLLKLLITVIFFQRNG